MARPYSLFALYNRPLLDLYRISQTNPFARWELFWAFLGLGVLYWLGWRAAQRTNSKAAWIIVVAGFLLFSLLLLCIFPFGAAHFFDNIMHGRILGVHGANPFYALANQFPADPFLPYVAWKKSPSAYGPGWELLAGITARLAGDGIIANILAFKLLAGIFLLASTLVVAAILRAVAPERALAGVVLLAWNPVILYETFGNGHNDIAMIFWVLLAAWLLLKRAYTAACVALVMGALFKFIPLLMLPAAGLIALRDLPTWRGSVAVCAGHRRGHLSPSRHGLLPLLAGCQRLDHWPAHADVYQIAARDHPVHVGCAQHWVTLGQCLGQHGCCLAHRTF